jgi:hypothetical protein
MLETFHWFRGEGFGLIVEDLLRLGRDPGVIAEGFRLLPRLVKPLLAVPGHAAWLLPTPEFRRAAFGRRISAASALMTPSLKTFPRKRLVNFCTKGSAATPGTWLPAP